MFTGLTNSLANTACREINLFLSQLKYILLSLDFNTLLISYYHKIVAKNVKAYRKFEFFFYTYRQLSLLGFYSLKTAIILYKIRKWCLAMFIFWPTMYMCIWVWMLYMLLICCRCRPFFQIKNKTLFTSRKMSHITCRSWLDVFGRMMFI